MVAKTFSACSHPEHGHGPSVTPGKPVPPVPSRRAGGRRKVVPRHWTWEWALVLLIISGGATWLVGMAGQAKPAISPDLLVKQIEQAAQRTAPDHNIYGGALRVDRNGQIASVTVTEIPPRACVLAGWDLSRKGLLSVNGVTPLRISAGKLAEICNDDDTATLTWIPRHDS